MEQYEQIKIKIEKVGIKRDILAEMLGLSYDTFSNYLYGRVNLDNTRLRYLSVFLDTVETLESLYHFENKEKIGGTKNE